jgi:hypothetical protein
VKRLVVFLLLAIFPSSAYAQSRDAGTDADALAAEIDRAWAQLQSNDCDTACRALDSMRRATERLCEMDPGDRCARARQKLADATARVRNACPSCPEATGRMFAPESEKAQEAPPPPASSPAVAEETVQKKNGGCGGCAIGSTYGGAPGAAWLLGLALLMLRKRRESGGGDDSGASARERRAP